MKRLRTIATNDRTLDTIQGNANAAISELQQIPILSGVLVQVSSSPSLDLPVNHSLGRRFQGFFIVSSDADCRVWNSATNNSQPDRQLLLRASAFANLTLYIF